MHDDDEQYCRRRAGREPGNEARNKHTLGSAIIMQDQATCTGGSLVIEETSWVSSVHLVSVTDSYPGLE